MPDSSAAGAIFHVNRHLKFLVCWSSGRGARQRLCSSSCKGDRVLGANDVLLLPLWSLDGGVSPYRAFTFGVDNIIVAPGARSSSFFLIFPSLRVPGA